MMMAMVVVAGALIQATAGEEIAPRVVSAALEQTRRPGRYDPTYRRIAYPGGDVAPDVGVCTDVVVRAFRAVGVDLQVKVHEDMLAAFNQYPKAWGLTKPDSNIDHRRVQNLQTYFRRRHVERPVSRSGDDYLAGDLVTWVLPGNLPHIGIVSGQHVAPADRPLVIHNIGNGPEVADILFDYPITGHYRYRGE
jgi:uncharacterized protein YijF (DUF1287 family)